jgi:hypothetical protein
MQDEWKQYGPKASCCSGCASHDATIAPPHSGELLPPNPINAWPKKQYPLGGYGPDPNSAGLTAWPDPANLQSQHEGDPCTLNGAPGTLHQAQDGKFVCVPNKRDQAASNIGPATALAGMEWSEGGNCTCSTGEPGRYVRQGNTLTCQPYDDDYNGDSAQARRDRAYFDSVRNLENAWRSW